MGESPSGSDRQASTGPASRPGLRRIRSSAPAPGRYCRSCGYDLAALESVAGVCPECGRGFNPRDPGTTSKYPLALVARHRRLRIGFAVLFALVFCVAWAYDILPRPAYSHDWRLWRWFGARFGLEENRSVDSVYSAWWWAGQIRSAEGRHWIHSVDQSPTLAPKPSWRLSMDWHGRYALDVHEPGVPWDQIVRTFNAMKPAMFGVRFVGGDGALNGVAFQVRGDEPAILSAIVHFYSLELQPTLVRPDQDYIWVYDALNRVMTTMDLSQAQAVGVEIAPFTPLQEEPRLIPRPEPQATNASTESATGASR